MHGDQASKEGAKNECNGKRCPNHSPDQTRPMGRTDFDEGYLGQAVQA
jgi:hypothetical protein